MRSVFLSKDYTQRGSPPDIGNGKIKGNLVCVVAVALFALSFPLADVLLGNWGSLTLIAVRNGVGFVILLLVCLYWTGWKQLTTAPWMNGIVIGAAGFGAGSTLLLIAQSQTNAVTASLAAAAMPVAGVTLEVVLDGRRLSIYFLVGLILVLAGSLLAIGMKITDASFGLGAMLGVFSTVIFAWGSRATVKVLGGISDLLRTLVTTAGMAIFSIGAYVVVLSLGVSGVHTRVVSLDIYEWGLILTYAAIALALSQIMWIKSVNMIGIGIASFHLNAVPFYVMLIQLGLGGVWDWQQAIGAAVLACGVILAQKKTSSGIVKTQHW